MQRTSSTFRPLRSFMASGFSPRFAAANPPNRHVSSNSGLKWEELGKREQQSVNPSAKDFIISLDQLSASTQGMKKVYNTDAAKKVFNCHGYIPPANSVEDERRARVNVVSGDEDASKTTLEVIDNKPYISAITGCELIGESFAKETCDDPMDEFVLPYSSHHDGSIYRGTQSWKRSYNIADRNETRLESTMFSDATGCFMRNGICMSHITCNMVQFFSLRLAKIPAEHGSVELYGYIAARDKLDTLLNYVINFSRDDPIIVEQGSLIIMPGPKRGIQLVDTTLIEFDMKIKIGEHEEEDLQLIDGVSIIDDTAWDRNLFTCRFSGDCGSIDLTGSRINHAVQATIEVGISQVQGSFSMHLGCFTCGLDDEIRLFNGDIVESRGLKKSVIAVAMNHHMDLKFKVAAESYIPVEHCFSFKASKHGCATEEIKTDFALIAVKVIWSTLE